MAFKETFMCFIFFGSSFIFALPHPNPCKAGESYWCQNIDTAAECGVLAYCKLKHHDLLKHKENKAVQDNKPVIIELYYESFCGGCRDFIAQQLFPAYQKLYSTGIFQIGLYPYGNAEEKQNPDGTYQFKCQHGLEECAMNIVETCATHMLHDQAAFMPYIHCVEMSGPSIPNAKACAQSLQVDWEKIESCANSTLGNNLEHEMAEKTNALEPPHGFVPWITMNGEHTWQIQDQATEDLIQLICDTYTGIKPHACRVHKKQSKDRCYRN